MTIEKGKIVAIDPATNAHPVQNATEQAGEDLVNNTQKIEARFGYGVECAADQLQKTGAGFLHAVIYDCTVAGTVVIRDSIAAGAGTIIKTLTLIAGQGSIIFDVEFGTGLYIDFGTATATINTSHR